MTPLIALTIGFFDGVHLGHQALFRRLSELGEPVCLTFENHPLSVISGAPPPLLTPTPERLRRIKEQVSRVISLPFTPELAEMGAESFIAMIRKELPFRHLLLGHDGRLGKNREGTPEVLRAIGEREGFTVEYLAPVGGKSPVSSGRIRRAVGAGELALAESLLGRPYTLTGEVIHGPGEGRRIGFPTANVDPAHQLLPPFGVYVVTVGETKGVANLGVAPTLHQHRRPLLEVHLFDTCEDLYGRELTVSLHHFLRPERTFASPEALKSQIAADISEAHSFFKKM